jgi:hypothetical protein
VTRRGPLLFSPEATRLINQGPPWRDPPEPPEPRERIVRPGQQRKESRVSTYYYVCCEVHRLAGPIVAGRSFPDRWWSEDWDAEFVRDHQGCAGNRGGVTLTVRSEHQIEDFSRESLPEAQSKENT